MGVDMNNYDEMEFKSNEELLIEYKRTSDHEVKQELVLRYVDTVRMIANQMRDVYSSFTQIDDIVNEGVIAIMKAIDKFDIDKNVKFETYISKRIRGLIIDLARKQDWVPRSVRKTNRDIANVVDEIYSVTGEIPTPEEIADKLGISMQKYWEQTSKNNIFGFISLDTVLEETGSIAYEKKVNATETDNSPEKSLLEMELNEKLLSKISSLRDREKQVLDMYYSRNMSMKEIAMALEVSEPRVSQIHSTAIKKLREKMQEYIEY